MTSDDSGGGLPGPVAEKFGAFEPRFFGIAFVLETPAMYQAWVAKSGIFPAPPGPILSPFDETCLLTAIEHETRHFHDALICPFANGIMLLRLMAAFNGVKVFNRALKSTANCLPVPVMTWVTMSPDTRATWLARLADDLPPGLRPPLRPLPLPHLEDGPAPLKPGFLHAGDHDPEAELNAFATATLSAYLQAADLMGGPARLLCTEPVFDTFSEEEKRAVGSLMTPRNVFEASALAVQVQAAWTNIGAGAANALTRHLLTSDIGYARMFREIATLSAPADRTGMVELSRVSAIAVWCLLGDPTVRDDFDPAVRLGRLRKVLLSSGGMASTSSVSDLWDEWDVRLKVKSWRTTVTEMTERTAGSVARYTDLAKQHDESHAAMFATVLEAYAANQVTATNLLLNDPDAYVDPLRYVETTAAILPRPLLSVELGEEFVVPFDTLPANDAIRTPRVLNKDGVQYWNRAVVDLSVPPRPALLDAALDLEFLCKTCDVAFSEEALSPLDRELFRTAVAEASGLTPVFVF